MRARLTSLLLVTAGVVGVGCASKPVNEPSAMVAEDHACATSSTASQAHDHDTDIDAILMQPTSDQRLTRINRQMYQSLRALDSELRRQERLAGCESHAQASAPGERGSDASVAAGAVVGGTARSNADGAIGTSATAASLTLSPSGAGTSGTAPGAPAPQATSKRNASL